MMPFPLEHGLGRLGSITEGRWGYAPPRRTTTLPPPGQSEPAPRQIHLFAFALHAVQTIVTAVLLTTAFSGQGWWYFLITGYDLRQTLVSYRLGWLIPFFFALSAASHAYQSGVSYSRRDTDAHDARVKEVIAVRWIEYSVSAGVMLWVIATLSGIFELSTLILLAVSNAFLQLTGYLAELRLLKSRPTHGAWFLRVGWFVFVAQWAVVFGHFFTALSDADERVPDMVYAIAPTLFVLFSLFAIPLQRWSSRLQKANETGAPRRWDYYSCVDVPYLWLSFIAKTTLGWMVLGGALREPETHTG